MAKIIYTQTDEAPALATHSFLPIVRAFARRANIELETRDISLAGRILAAFNDTLPVEFRTNDALTELGQLAQQSEANIIKLPNISASVPQLKAAIAELQSHGIPLPDYPEDPESDTERETKKRYDRVKGSAVNPVLREGNSDRRAPKAVKAYAQKHPHSMGAWNAQSKTHVAHMESGDFYGSERSMTLEHDEEVRLVFIDSNGDETELKSAFALQKDEIIDAAVMDLAQLRSFAKQQMNDAKAKGVLFSLHLKATMMKVSDPVIFGHAVSVYFKSVFDKHQTTFNELGVHQMRAASIFKIFGVTEATIKKRHKSEKIIQPVSSIVFTH